MDEIHLSFSCLVYCLERAVWCTKLSPMRGLEERYIVRRFTLHSKALFPRLEPVTYRSHDNNFSVALMFPFCVLSGKKKLTLNFKISTNSRLGRWKWMLYFNYYLFGLVWWFNYVVRAFLERRDHPWYWSLTFCQFSKKLMIVGECCNISLW